MHRIDVKLRAQIRYWLDLKHDTKLEMFTAAQEAGGLGIPSVAQTITLLRMKRLTAMQESNDPILRELAFGEGVLKKLEVARRHCKINGTPYTNKDKLKKLVNSNLWQSADGRGLRNESLDRRGMSWIRDGSWMTGRAFLCAVSVRCNLLQTPARKARCRPNNHPRAGICDKCHTDSVATLGHILQSCPSVHGLMVKRHDEVLGTLIKYLKASKRIDQIFVEPRIERMGEASYVKPDVVIVRKSKITILDVQILPCSKNSKWLF